MVLLRHERLDGSGQPDGLRGDQITIGARIIAVADVVEAIVAHRPYRSAKGVPFALDTIRDGSGRLFDPVAAAACIRLIEEGRIELEQ